MKSLHRVAIAAAATAFAATAASAVTVVPVSATGSSSFPTYDASFAIDQGGNSAVTDWASNSQGAGSFLDLDLGAVYTLSGVSLVDRVTSGGGNGGFVGGTTDFTTSFSLTAYSDATFTTAVGSATFTKATPASPTVASDFAFSGALTGFAPAQYVRYAVLATNGPNPGLSNITFEATAVPEPASWALLIGGVGMMGGALRRRPARIAAAA